MGNKLIHVSLIVILAIVASSDLLAATKSKDVVNATDINAMFFWIADPAGTAFFDKVDPKDDAKDWNAVFKNTSQLVVLEPPSGDPTVLANNGKFQVQFDYTVKDVDIYWAEVLFDNVSSVVSIKAAGHGHFDDKKNNPNNKDWFVDPMYGVSSLSLSMVNDINTHFGTGPVVAPVPIPSSVVLLLSAIAMVSVTQRRKIDLGQTMKFAAQKTADLGSTLKFAAQTTVDLGSTLTFKAQSETN